MRTRSTFKPSFITCWLLWLLVAVPLLPWKMLRKICGKKHVQLFVKIVAALAVIYITLLIIHSLNCSKKSTIDKDEESDDSIPARIKIGLPDKEGRVQFFASFDSKDLLRIWNKRPKRLPPPTPTPAKAPVVNYNLYNDSLCKNKKVEWIFYVMTSPEEFSRRNLLRETWANVNLLKSNSLQVIFLMGTTSDQTTQEKLVAEHNKYQDIVQGDFLDTLKTKSLKALLGMKWISEFCGHAKYALKANDASFVNIFGIMALLENSLMTNQTIMCSLWGENQMPIQRDPSKCGAWCVKEDEFPGKSYFPQYCAGVGYLTKVPLLQEMYKASFESIFFWIEDVYITGVLSKNLKKPADFINIQSRFSLDHELFKSNYLDSKSAIDLFLTEITDEKLFRQLWKALINKLPPKWFSLLSDSVIATDVKD